MTDTTLLNTLRALGYNSDTIKAVMAAAESAERAQVAQVLASREGLATPAQVASTPSGAARLRAVDNMIYSASGCKYRLPRDGRHVDLLEVERAIRGASIDCRAAIKSGLHSLSLIGR